MVSCSQARNARLLARSSPSHSQLTRTTVKFDTEKLPPILNALETTNNGQKLVLEVAVCQAPRPRTPALC